MKKYINLFTISNCSAGETVVTPEEIVEFAVNDGAKAVALTDFNSVQGLSALCKAANKHSNFKAIYGVKITAIDLLSENRRARTVTLLAQNKTGLKNIYKIMSSAYTDNISDCCWPCVSFDIIKENKASVLVGFECENYDLLQVNNSDNIFAENLLLNIFGFADFVGIKPWHKYNIGTENDVKSVLIKTVGFLNKIGKVPVAETDANCFTKYDKLCFDILHSEREEKSSVHFYELPLKKYYFKGTNVLSKLEMMQKITGVDVKSIKLEDIDIPAFFRNNELTGIVPNNKIVQKLISVVSPKSFSDVLKISGFLHGTDVWNENAENLIGKVCSVKEAIAFREDVMQSLMNYGLDKKTSFEISEQVRKGIIHRKGFSDEQIKILNEHNVPEWMIQSMKKIMYLFSKSFAVEHLVNLARLTWYKIYYPAAFYAATLTYDIAPFFDYSILTEGEARVRLELERFNKEWAENCFFSRDEKWAENEKTVLESALECYNKGIGFLPVDANLSVCKAFTIENGNLRIPQKFPR